MTPTINNVKIRVIPHNKQRYDTVGDWQIKKGRLVISISSMGDWRYEMLVAVHELVEALICNKRGITGEAVDEYDMGNMSSDPGLSPDAPYHEEHMFALIVENMLARELCVDKEKLEQAICEA